MIRDIKLNDVRALAKYTAVSFHDYCRDPDIRIAVVDLSWQPPEGYIIIAHDGNLQTNVLHIGVHPQYRRRGIGRLLISWAEIVTVQRGNNQLIQPHDSLHPFFEACGFVHRIKLCT